MSGPASSFKDFKEADDDDNNFVRPQIIYRKLKGKEVQHEGYKKDKPPRQGGIDYERVELDEGILVDDCTINFLEARMEMGWTADYKDDGINCRVGWIHEHSGMPKSWLGRQVLSIIVYIYHIW